MDYKVFDTLLDSVFVINKDEHVIYCNESAALITDLSIKRMTRGKPFREIFNFSPLPFDELNCLAEINDPSPYRELLYVTSTGRNGRGQITIQRDPHSPTENPHWLIFMRDVSLEENLQRKYRAELDQKEAVIVDLRKAQVELERYSKNLEQMVAERTAELQKLYNMQSAMLNSLGQGFFVFDHNGLCSDTYSRVCEEVLESNPAGKYVWDILKLQTEKIDGFQKWMITLFAEMLPFEDLAPLGPQTFKHSKDRYISLGYFPMRTSGKVTGVVVVASDQTEEVKAKREAQKEKAFAKMITHIIKSKKQFHSFIQDTQNILADLECELNEGVSRPVNIEVLFRLMHTIKGGAASFSAEQLASLAHAAENQLVLFSEASETEKIRILPQIVNIFKELKSEFAHILDENKELLGKSFFASNRVIEISVNEIQQFSKRIISDTDRLHLQQDFIEKLIKEPIISYFHHYDEITQRLAISLNKTLSPIAFQGDHIKIIPEPYLELFSTLVHAFRNAVDHGIEEESIRTSIGKPAEGRIDVCFDVQNNASAKYLHIKISDDGQGINPHKILAKLRQKGIAVSDNETTHNLIQHIFDSHFSTKEEVTQTSGRGVGMDAIKVAVEKMNGTTFVQSEVGKGTTLNILVPYYEDLQSY